MDFSTLFIVLFQPEEEEGGTLVFGEDTVVFGTDEVEL